MAIQQATYECECGGQSVVTPTASAWEFDWRCACGRRGTLSWFHGAAPPTYRAPDQWFIGWSEETVRVIYPPGPRRAAARDARARRRAQLEAD